MPDARSGPDPVAALTGRLLQEGAALGQALPRTSGVGSTGAAALRLLDQSAGGSCTVGDLTAALNLSSGSTTELVDRLEAAGLVRRERDGSDRRRVHVRLEPSARAFGQELLAPWGLRIRRAAAGLSPRERAAVSAYLTAVLTDPPPADDGQAAKPG